MILDDHRLERIARFMMDKDTAEAVRDHITMTFLRKRSGDDVHIKAAERVAIDLLFEAWKELEKVQLQKEEDKREFKQVGL